MYPIKWLWFLIRFPGFHSSNRLTVLRSLIGFAALFTLGGAVALAVPLPRGVDSIGAPQIAGAGALIFLMVLASRGGPRRRAEVAAFLAVMALAVTVAMLLGCIGLPLAADLVLGAEIAYRAADAEALAACIPNRLAPGGTAVLCSDEKRAPLKLCGELLRKRGFVVEDSVLTLTVTPEGEAATTHRVRVVRARRSSSSSVGAS